jgi:hypothetical protein
MRCLRLTENAPAIAPGFSFLEHPILPAAGLFGGFTPSTAAVGLALCEECNPKLAQIR